jgi:multidrug resistance efflux pump
VTRRLPSWRQALAVVAIVAMLVVVIRGLLAPSPTVPNDADRAEATAEVQPTAGLDERFARPEGFEISGNGVVEPRDRQTDVAAAVAGRIEAVPVDEGDHVEAGDVLVALEDAVERATLAAAEADLAEARASYAKARRGDRPEDVAAALADVEAARAKAALSADTLRRSEQIAVGGHLSLSDLDTARRNAEADAAAAARAEARLAAASGGRAEDVASAAARVGAAQARVDEARARLAQRTVRSPLSGEVLQVLVRPGEYQQPGGAEPLVVVGDTGVRRVRMDLDERYVGHVAIGASGLVRAIAWPGRDFPARVVEVGHRMGRKNVRTDDPIERNDTKILEVVLELDDAAELVVGQRVVCYVHAEDGATASVGGEPGAR